MFKKVSDYKRARGAIHSARELNRMVDSPINLLRGKDSLNLCYDIKSDPLINTARVPAFDKYGTPRASDSSAWNRSVSTFGLASM